MRNGRKAFLALVGALVMALGACGDEGTISTPKDGGRSDGMLIPDFGPPPGELTVTIAADPQSGDAPLEVHFTAEVTGGQNIIYAWDFGDLSASSEGAPTHTYEEAGTYSVTLQVVDSTLRQASDSLDLTVTGGTGALNVVVTASPDSGNAPLRVDLEAQVTGGTSPYTYVWDLGDGSTSDQASLTHTYTDAGTYDATVQVTDADGLQRQGSITITVGQASALNVAIVANPTEGMAPLSVHFEGVLTGGTPPYITSWDFGDGETSRNATPTHTFTAPGDYTVTLDGSDRSGGTGQATVSIHVESLGDLTVTVTADPTGGEAPLTVAFQTQLTGGSAPYAYEWSFGDGGTARVAAPQHTYSTAGQFVASVVVTDAQSRTGEGTMTVNVDAPSGPLAVQATVTPESGEVPLIVDFAAAASGGSPPYQYLWAFGDGDVSSDQQGTHMFDRVGEYNASVTVMDMAGDTVNDSVTVTVTEPTGPLSVRAEADVLEGPAPLAVAFRAVVAGGATPYRFSWDFGDGSTSSTGTPTHTFLDGGEHDVVVSVVDGNGDSAEDQLTITVMAPMEVEILADPPVDWMPEAAPAEVNFEALVTGGVEPFGYQWDFGDGGLSTEELPVHTFFDACSCLVSLTVTDSTSAQARATLVAEITSAGDPLRAEAMADPISGLAPLTVSFEAGATGGMPPYSYYWDLGDGEYSEEEAFDYEYLDAGTYSVELVVYDDLFDEASDTITITVGSEENLVVHASASPLQGEVPLDVDFTATVQGGVGPFAYEWTFGDGNTSVEEEPTHTYLTAGSFTATLEVTDDNGVSSTDSLVITVSSAGAPSVVLTADPDQGEAPLQVNFVADVMGGSPPLTFSWSFGDGSPPLETALDEARHTYSASGSYSAFVVVIDSAGQTATDSVDIAVGSDDTPAVTASATPTSGLAPLQVAFTGQATGGDAPLTYRWEFGDGESSAERSPTHLYERPGRYQATFTAEDADGDADSASISISAGANDTPTASAQASPTQGSAPLSVQFSGEVTGGNGPFTFEWDFRDGSSSDEQNPLHVFAFAGTYDVLFTVTDSDGDQGADTVTVTAGGSAELVTSITAAPQSGIAPLTVSFTAQVNGGQGPYTYEWDFGDGQVGMGPSVSHTYTRSSPDPYTVLMMVTDSEGEVAMDEVEIVVGAPAQMSVSAQASPTGGVAPLAVSFSAVVSGGLPPYTYLWDLGDNTMVEQQSAVHTYRLPGTFTVTLLVEDSNSMLVEDDLTIVVTAPSDSCSVLDQDCPPGQKCTIGADGLICDDGGPLAEGQECGLGGVDDCQAGLICVGDVANGYICEALCEPQSLFTGCAPGYECFNFYRAETINAGICYPFEVECSVTAQDCGGGEKCSIGANGIECLPDGTVGVWEECGLGGQDDCAAGMLCLGDWTYYCYPLCEPESTITGCEAGLVCMPFVELYGANLGVCDIVLVEECSVTAQDCGSGEKCSLGQSGIECVSDGGVSLGGECGQEGWDDCAAGAICLWDGVAQTCIAACEPYSVDDGCSGGEECYLLTGLEALNIGVCLAPPQAECSVWDQDCGLWEKCTVGADSLECVEDGYLYEGEECGLYGYDDCSAGLICLDDGVETACWGLCEPWDQLGCGAGQTCAFLYPEINAGYCLDFVWDCSLVDQDCGGGQKCSLGYNGVECGPAGTVGDGGACALEGLDDCAVGLICLDDGEASTCYGLCEPLSNPTGCDGGLTCYLLYDGLNMGFCL